MTPTVTRYNKTISSIENNSNNKWKVLLIKQNKIFKYEQEPFKGYIQWHSK